MSHTTIASWALLIWRALESYEIDPRPVFRRAGLDPDHVSNPRWRYPAVRLREAWIEAVRQSGDPCFGLTAASHWHPTSWHALGIAWLASRTLKDGFERIARYGRMISTAAECTLTKSEDRYWFSIEARISDLSPAPETVDTAFAVLLRMIRMTWGPEFKPLGVALTRPPTGCAERLNEFFGCEVQFDAPRSHLCVARDDFERPLPTANVDLLAETDTMIADYLARMVDSDVSSRARAMIAKELSSGTVSDESVAGALNMSVRTFQRRLNEEKTSYKRLLQDVRRELALRYIDDESLSITEISYLLGFSEPSSFARVFKRWTGQAPSESRAH